MSASPSAWPAGRRALVLAAALLLAGCSAETDSGEFVARVGDRLLTKEDLGQAIQADRLGLDSVETARRYIDQWITFELLFAEARRRGLRADPGVKRRLEESERSILVSALVDQLYRNPAAEASPEDVITYFESHRDQLGLLEPFVRIRYLQLASPDSAAAAARALASVDTSDAEGWLAVADRFALDPEAVRDLAGTYAAETRLMAHLPRVRQAIGALAPGRTSPVIEDGGQYHVVQLVDRVPAGTVPRVEWIEPALRQRLQIEARKQLYARLVQDLRNEAVAREFIETH
jgi:hypothetical protein